METGPEMRDVLRSMDITKEVAIRVFEPENGVVKIVKVRKIEWQIARAAILGKNQPFFFLEQIEKSKTAKDLLDRCLEKFSLNKKKNVSWILHVPIQEHNLETKILDLEAQDPISSFNFVNGSVIQTLWKRYSFPTPPSF